MTSLSGRVALITGGSRGIGRAAVLALAATGAKVAINYAHKEADARQTAEAVAQLGGDAWLVRGDVGEEATVEAIFQGTRDHFGRLDIFVSCAVLPVARTVLEMTSDDWERTMRVNARAFLLGSRLAAAGMREGFGRIIALSSTGTHFVRNLRYAPLAMAKGAVEAAVRFLAVELAPRGITVNVVAPGPTNTEAFDAMAGGDPAQLRAGLAARTPMGRLGEPQDSARLIAFLCSEEAQWITGQLIFSDGGYSLR